MIRPAGELEPEEPIYTGVGSRSSSPRVCLLMAYIARRLARNGWILRSGRAPEADQFFEIGCLQAGGLREIYLPWKNFPRLRDIHPELQKLLDKEAIADVPDKYTFVPSFNEEMKRILKAAIGDRHFNALSPGAMKLHLRNVCQVYGLMDYPGAIRPSTALFYWTPARMEAPIGGTATTVKLAILARVRHIYNIEVFLNNKDLLEEAMQILECFTIPRNLPHKL